MLCLLVSMTEADGAQGRLCVVIWYQPQGWGVESIRFYGPNFVICEVVTNVKYTPIICEYLPPSILEHLPELEESLTRFRYQDPIVLGYISTNIVQSQNSLGHQVADLLMEFGLMGLLHHFWQIWWYRHMKTWSRVR